MTQDPKLAALADNGGPTPTHALLSGSSALNTADASSVIVDQRGVVRPQGTASDVGAYENCLPVIAQGATVSGTMNEDGSPVAWSGIAPTLTATDLDVGAVLT